MEVTQTQLNGSVNLMSEKQNKSLFILPTESLRLFSCSSITYPVLPGRELHMKLNHAHIDGHFVQLEFF